MSEYFTEMRERIGEDMVNVFVPTTPNPTTGFLIVVRRQEIIYMDTTVDEAFKMIFTLGVITPSWKAKTAPDAALAPQQTPS
jgi:uncharacterized membrane protein